MQAKASVDMLLQCSGDNAGDLLEPEDYDVIGGANEPSAQRGEIALVLQGGGALSAYEYGIFSARLTPWTRRKRRAAGSRSRQ
jgi:hypothetical protein